MYHKPLAEGGTYLEPVRREESVFIFSEKAVRALMAMEKFFS